MYPFRGTPLHSAAALTLAEATSGIELSFPRQAAKVRYVSFKTLTIAIDDLGIEPQIIKFDIQGAELNCAQGRDTDADDFIARSACRNLLF